MYLYRFKAVATKSKMDLVNEGFTEFTIEDFHNTVSKKKKEKINLLFSVNSQTSMTTFVFLIYFKVNGSIQ